MRRRPTPARGIFRPQSTQTTCCDEPYSFRHSRGFLSSPPAAFELGRRVHADGGVATPGIEPALDVVEDRQSGCSTVYEDGVIEQLAFERGPKALGKGVVKGIATTTH